MLFCYIYSIHPALFGILSNRKRQRISRGQTETSPPPPSVSTAKHLRNAAPRSLLAQTARAVSAEDAHVTFRREQPGGGRSVGFIRGEQGCVHRLHAGGAGEGAHQPGVDAIHVVNVEARQEPDRIAVLKIHHADHTPGAGKSTCK